MKKSLLLAGSLLTTGLFLPHSVHATTKTDKPLDVIASVTKHNETALEKTANQQKDVLSTTLIHKVLPTKQKLSLLEQVAQKNQEAEQKTNELIDARIKTAKEKQAAEQAAKEQAEKAARDAAQKEAEQEAATATTPQASSISPSINPSANSYPWGQCTWGVKVLAPWAGDYWGNANQWTASATAAGFETGTTPRAGAIAVWLGNHVAYVTDVDPSGQIQVLESNYAGNPSIANYRGWFNLNGAQGSVSYIYPPK